MKYGKDNTPESSREEKLSTPPEAQDLPSSLPEVQTKSGSLPQSIILASLVISGVGLLGIINAFNIDWYLPTLAYGVTIYFAWKKFF